MKDSSLGGRRPLFVAIGTLEKCCCCDDPFHLIEVGDDIVCTTCWADIPRCNVLVWERAA